MQKKTKTTSYSISQIEKLIEESYNRQQKKLYIVYLPIGDDGLRMIMEKLSGEIKYITLINSGISGKGLSTIYSRNLSQLKDLWLDQNNIGTLGIKMLSKSKIPNLSMLSIERCQLGNQSVRYLTKANFPQLAYLYMKTVGQSLKDIKFFRMENGQIYKLSKLRTKNNYYSYLQNEYVQYCVKEIQYEVYTDSQIFKQCKKDLKILNGNISYEQLLAFKILVFLKINFFIFFLMWLLKLLLDMFEYLRAVRKLVFSFSYFQATQFFRFRKEQGYVHSSAGISSLLLRIIIAISLFYNILAVVQRQNVSVTNNISYSYPPSGSLIEQSNNFMVAFEMTAPVQGLQIFFFQNKDTRRSKSKKILGTAQKCTVQHWNGVQLTKLQFKNRNMKNWYCMPKDLKIFLQGARYQKMFSYFSIEIDCKNCSIHQSQIQLIFHFSNPMINPSNNKDYLTYYIHSDYSITITNQGTNDALQILMEDFTINSDTSILPWSNYKTDKGLIVTDAQILKIKNPNNSFHSQIIFKKSAKQTSYIRNFLKILDAFYFIIGSFAPTVVTFAFFIQPMLTSIFQMRFANCLYRLEEGKKYGICDYICEKLFNFMKKWERVISARQMLSKVMEVQYLYERLNFVQRSIKFLFKDHQLSGLRLMQKDSILEANQKYRKYQIRKIIKNYITNQHYKQIKSLADQTDLLLKPRNDQQQIVSYIQQDISEPIRQNIQQKHGFQPPKYFQFNNDSQNEDNQHENIQQNKQYYLKTVNDFIKLRQQAESQNQGDDLKRKDIQLMQQLEKRMNIRRSQRINVSQSMIITNLQRQYQLR